MDDAQNASMSIEMKQEKLMESQIEETETG